MQFPWNLHKVKHAIQRLLWGINDTRKPQYTIFPQRHLFDFVIFQNHLCYAKTTNFIIGPSVYPLYVLFQMTIFEQGIKFYICVLDLWFSLCLVYFLNGIYHFDCCSESRYLHWGFRVIIESRYVIEATLQRIGMIFIVDFTAQQHYHFVSRTKNTFREFSSVIMALIKEWKDS